MFEVWFGKSNGKGGLAHAATDERAAADERRAGFIAAGGPRQTVAGLRAAGPFRACLPPQRPSVSCFQPPENCPFRLDEAGPQLGNFQNSFSFSFSKIILKNH